MNRFLRRAALVLLAVVGLGGRSANGAPRPNIIMVMPDDVGWGDFGCHGNPIILTPAVDGFWKQSVRFTDFHVSPTCAPTRAALLTGRHEFKSGVTHTINERERLSLKAVTLPEVLRAAGYATGLFGKWHLGDERDRWPDRRGFDEFFIHGAGGIGQSYAGSCGDVPGNTNFDPVILHNGTLVKTQGYCTDVFFQRALRWMETVKERGPFLAFITPNAAHAPLDVPDAYAQRHRGQVDEPTAKFYGMIENIDENFGRLLQRLEDWDLTAGTLVVFLTDNGGTVGVKIHNGGLRSGKNTPYEGGTRVPSLWRWPAGFAGGRDVGVLTAHLDVFPTLAEIAQAPLSEDVRKQIEGRSLVPLLTDPQAEWPDRTFITHVGRWPRGGWAGFKHTGCSIRNTRYSLVNNTELYDLATDRAQTTNVLDQHPEIVAALRASYDTWWDSLPPHLENEDVVPPVENAFRALYREQFGE
jgi:arylsulfatase A-like enzyme